jgi:hypothetical protein
MVPGRSPVGDTIHAARVADEDAVTERSSPQDQAQVQVVGSDPKIPVGSDLVSFTSVRDSSLSFTPIASAQVTDSGGHW